jgi:hypothetical protein
VGATGCTGGTETRAKGASTLLSLSLSDGGRSNMLRARHAGTGAMMPRAAKGRSAHSSAPLPVPAPAAA